jgi:hypothetical protein
MDRTRVRRGPWWPFATTALLWASGCAMFQDDQSNLRDTVSWGDGVRRQPSNDTEGPNRPIKLGGDYGGVSAESQKIEHNLGIR